MDYDKVTSDIMEMMERAYSSLTLTSQICIYSVPSKIRQVNDDAYTPQVVSIGPLHRSDPMVKRLESWKLVLCKDFFQRPMVVSDLSTLVRCVEDNKPDVESCYMDKIDISSKEFIKVILMDCIFIIQLFLKFYLDEWCEHDYVKMESWLMDKIRIDLLMLENQIPFFIIDKLYNIAVGSNPDSIPSFLELTGYFFKCYNSCQISLDDARIHHFTDVVRYFYSHPFKMLPHKQLRIKIPRIQFPSATEMSDVGVRLVGDTNNKCLLDIGFLGKVLTVPTLTVNNCTEILFRNMIALEQLHYANDSIILDYLSAMNFLIKTSNDVDLLVRKGVLVNWLGDSNSVAKLFNLLVENITYMDASEYYVDLCYAMDLHCKDTVSVLKGSLRRDYCRTPWQTLATITAVALLVLTFIQTWYSAKGDKK